MSDDAPDRLRVGDDERQRAVSALGEHFALGRLDRQEFDTRVQAAYGARTRADLHPLFTDLPEPAPFRPAGPAELDLGPGFHAGRAARRSAPLRRRYGPPPAPAVVPVLAVFALVSLFVGHTLLPLLLVLLVLGWHRGALGRRS